MRFRDEGKFVVYCQKYHEVPQPLKFLVDGRFGEGKREVSVKFEKWSKNGPKRGILVTILDCFDTPENRVIDNEIFDQQFTKLGFNLEKATVMQVHKNGTTLNGNRFVVLDTQEIKGIPDLISFCDGNTARQVSFKCRYRGQT